MLRELHLTGDGFSGRGVRLRELGPDDADEISIAAGKDSGDDGISYAKAKVRRALERIICAVTPANCGEKEAAAARDKARAAKAEALKPVLDDASAQGKDALATATANVAMQVKTAGDEAADEARQNALRTANWIPVTALQLSLKSDPLYYGKIFKEKDHETLSYVFNRLYSASIGDAERILGKALQVSEG